ncbi:MAG: tetratricopeptide repeat protein [Cytophagaceae bacterium]|jgi:tetratricopeptide (TPR) repeat protein|nr:tetratricopeptide repeat protein [Cytophagaceae bacterium]
MKTTLWLSLASLSWMTALHAQSDKAALHVEKEQYNAATSIYKGLLKSDPKKAAEYYYYLGDIAWRKDKQDSAKYYFMEGVKLDETQALNYVGIGKSTFSSNKVESSKSFEKAIALVSPKNALIPEAIAEAYILNGTEKSDFVKAVDYLQKVILNDPKRISPQILLGDAYGKLNEGSKQAEAYNRAQYLLEQTPSPLLKLKFGKMYANVRNFDLAVKYYNEGLALDPTYGPIYRELGDLYSRFKMYDKAITNYENYLKNIDKNQDVEFKYAYFLYQSKDFTKSYEILQQLEAAKYSNKQMVRLKAYVLYEKGSYAESLQQFETLFSTFQVNEISARDYEFNGKALIQSKKEEEGVKYLQLAMQKDTTRLDLCTDIANYYVKKEDYPQAIQYLTKQVNGNPKDASGVNALGMVYYYAGNYSKSDSVFTILTILKPNSITGYLYKARSQSQLDPELKTGLAKSTYEKVIELAAANTEKYKKELIESYEYIGYYYVTQKDKTNADIQWNKVLLLDPANTKAKNGLLMK